MYIQKRGRRRRRKGPFQNKIFIYLNVQFETLTNKGVVIIDEQLDATWWFVIF